MEFKSIIADKLTVLGLKLGFLETSTYGMLASNFAMLEGFENIFKQGLIVTHDTSIPYLDLDMSNWVSRTNARRGAMFLVKERECDIGLAIFSTSNNPHLFFDEQVQEEKTYEGLACISIYVGDRFHDFELHFKHEDNLKDRLLLVNKAIGELVSVVLHLK